MCALPGLFPNPTQQHFFPGWKKPLICPKCSVAIVDRVGTASEPAAQGTGRPVTQYFVKGGQWHEPGLSLLLTS